MLQLLHNGYRRSRLPARDRAQDRGAVRRTRLGALASGVDEATRQALFDYGMHLGYAFQIADDVLDYSANAEGWARTGRRPRRGQGTRCR